VQESHLLGAICVRGLYRRCGISPTPKGKLYSFAVCKGTFLKKAPPAHPKNFKNSFFKPLVYRQKNDHVPFLKFLELEPFFKPLAHRHESNMNLIESFWSLNLFSKRFKKRAVAKQLPFYLLV